MKPSSRNRRLSWSVSSTSRTQSLSRSEIELDANRHIHLPSEGEREEYFLDIRSHRTHRGSISPEMSASGRDSRRSLRIRFQANPIIHRVAKTLFAAQVPLRRLHR